MHFTTLAFHKSVLGSGKLSSLISLAMSREILIYITLLFEMKIFHFKTQAFFFETKKMTHFFGKN